jgi:hypothetical protein
MAEYCKQCSIRIFGEDTGEMAGLSTSEDTNNGMYAQALCEGCGPTLVDHEGTCRYIDCLHKHGAAEEKPATLLNLTAPEWKFVTFCLGCAYAHRETSDETVRNYINENHDRVAAKVSAVLVAMKEVAPGALVTTGERKVEPVALTVVAAEVNTEHRDGMVDEMLYRLSQPVVDDICVFIKRRQLDEAKKLVVEHAGVSPEIAQQFIDHMMRDWEKHSGSE